MPFLLNNCLTDSFAAVSYAIKTMALLWNPAPEAIDSRGVKIKRKIY